MDKKYYYKAMSKDMQCRGYQFKVGETYTIESKELELCSDRVFHFCERLEDTIDYYSVFSSKHFLIEVLGDIVTEDSKSGSNKIRIVREISREEIEEHIQNKATFNARCFLALYSPNIKTLERLSKAKKWVVRLLVASNINIPVHILEQLAKDINSDVRSAVVENLNTPAYLLKELAKDNNSDVRRVVGENPNTPTHLLVDLSKDKYNYVRRAVAKNPNTPIYILEVLSKDEDISVRLAVTSNPNMPTYILEELVKDENKEVKEIAEERLKEITQ